MCFPSNDVWIVKLGYERQNLTHLSQMYAKKYEILYARRTGRKLDMRSSQVLPDRL